MNCFIELSCSLEGWRVAGSMKDFVFFTREAGSRDVNSSNGVYNWSEGKSVAL